MRYGHVDKKTGIELDRDVYADHFAEPGDIKTNYMIRIHGDTILEGSDPIKLANQLMKMYERLYMISDFLRRKNAIRGTIAEPSGDK